MEPEVSKTSCSRSWPWLAGAVAALRLTTARTPFVADCGSGAANSGTRVSTTASDEAAAEVEAMLETRDRNWSQDARKVQRGSGTACARKKEVVSY